MGGHCPASHKTSIGKRRFILVFHDFLSHSIQVPAQPNYCDCGVYLLHFVEQFMSDPETFSQQILVRFIFDLNARV